MSNSKLISYTKISPNKTSPRNHKIDTITIHCYVGQVTVEEAGKWFAKSSTEASCNYVIGRDGQIGLIVDENDRSWCSSNPANDHRAITIECASDTKDPYAINDKVYESLIELCADICERNDIKELKWKGDKSLIGQVDEQNMTVHRWFKNKACPGEYIYSRLGQIAAEVNAKLGLGKEQPKTQNADTVTEFPETPFSVKVIIDDLNYRSKPSMEGEINGQTGKGEFTIVEVVDGWGKLKSGVGYIWLGNASYCEILNKVETQPKPKKKSVTEIAKEVIDGKWGSGDARKKALTNAGYNYNEVQCKVNELLNVKPTKKKTVTEIAREVIAGKWGNGDVRKKALIKAGYDFKAIQKRVNELL